MDFQKEFFLMTFHRQVRTDEMTQNQDISDITNEFNASRRLKTGLNRWVHFLGKLKNMRIRVTFDPPEHQEPHPVNDVMIL